VSDCSAQPGRDSSHPPQPQATRAPEEMVTFIVSVISALLQRRIDNTHGQLEKLKQLKHEELTGLWVQLNKSAPAGDALHIFTNWIEGQLDGDGLS
jgi:hypothetical protein